MKTVYLVRHGETFQNREKVVQGADPTQGRLTEKGVRQAHLLGQHLANTPFDMVFCSPLERTVLTLSQILLARTGKRTLPIRFADALKEVNLGVLHGCTHAEWRAMTTGNPMAFAPEGGESWEDVKDRTSAFFRQEVLPGPWERVLIVAHGGVNRGILAPLLGMTIGETWQEAGIGTPQSNTCVNRIELNASGEMTGLIVNDTTHLAGEFSEATAGQLWHPDRRAWSLRELGVPPVTDPQGP